LPAEYAPRSNKDCEKSHQEANSAAASVADAPERLSPTDLAFEKRCHKPRGGTGGAASGAASPPIAALKTLAVPVILALSPIDWERKKDPGQGIEDKR
jgi:hypothetical protein